MNVLGVSPVSYENIRGGCIPRNFCISGSHREWNMPEKNKNKSIIDEFFWEIPGDVPGKRAQDDPYQSASPAPDPDYQFVPQPITNQSSKCSSEADVSSHQTDIVSNNVTEADVSSDASMTETSNDVSMSDASDDASTSYVSNDTLTSDISSDAPITERPNDISISDVSNRNSFRWLPGLMVLLFVMGGGGASYQYLIDNPSDKRREENVSELTRTTELNNQKNTTIPTVKPEVTQVSTPAPAQKVAVKPPKIIEIVLGEKNKTMQSKLRVITHVVVRGDTLWDIAETYVKNPFRYPELAKLNKIKNPDLIYPDEVVRIHIYEQASV